MVVYYCPYCERETEHLNVSDAAASAGVTRRTVYDWLNRALVHFVHRPSGRKFICIRSLVISNGLGSVPPPARAPIHTLSLGRSRNMHRAHR